MRPTTTNRQWVAALRYRRSGFRRGTTVAVLIAFLFSAPLARAQSGARLGDIPLEWRRVAAQAAGTKLAVKLHRRARILGKFAAINGDQLLLEEEKRIVAVPLADVSRVWRVEFTTGNGELGGVIFGALVGSGILGSLVCAFDCRRSDAAKAMLVGGGFGAGIAYAEDLVIPIPRTRRKLLYSALDAELSGRRRDESAGRMDSSPVLVALQVSGPPNAAHILSDRGTYPHHLFSLPRFHVTLASASKATESCMGGEMLAAVPAALACDGAAETDMGRLP